MQENQTVKVIINRQTYLCIDDDNIISLFLSLSGLFKECFYYESRK